MMDWRQFLGLTPKDRVVLAQAPRLPPEKQWWNVGAKIDAGERIGKEERRRAAREAHGILPHNNEFDAMRHARWSQRMSQEIGPVFSNLAGVWHEAAGMMRGQPISEAMMDLRNNSEGNQAAAEGRPIDPSRLQMRPLSPAAAYAEEYQQYQDTAPDRGYGPAGERYDPEGRYPPYR